MIVVGLTGSIAMGKTTTARMLRWLKVPIHDSDATVHALLGQGGAAVEAVGQRFAGVVRDGVVDRAALGARVFTDRSALAALEAILHPAVARSATRFVAKARRDHRQLVVLDIPLLFETGAERRCDAVIVVTAPAFLQRQRALSRAGMTKPRLDAILSRQTPDHEKRRRADWVVRSGLGRGFALRDLKRALRAAKLRAAHRQSDGPSDAA